MHMKIPVLISVYVYTEGFLLL